MDDSVSLHQKIALIQKQPLFSKLADKEIEILASLLKEKRIKAGETIVTEGVYVDSVYFIVKGTADVQYATVNEKSKTIQQQSHATLRTGDAIGLNETGFYSLTGLRTATVVALSDMELLRLSVAEFHGFALAYSHVNEVMRENARKILTSS